MLAAFIHGYLMALGLILPLGPQNAFVLAQGATQPRLIRALPVALVASLADTALILIAVLGVSVVILTVPGVRLVLVIAGVIFLIVMGTITWRSASREQGEDQAEAAAQWPLRRQVIFALSVSLLNPHAILDTVGLIGPTAILYQADARVAFTLGVILNSWLWFIGLTLVGRLIGSVKQVRAWLSRASAVVMWLGAVYLVLSLFR